MTTGPTRGASDHRVWSARPVRAFLVRAAIVVVPILASFAMTRFVLRALWHPDGWSGLIVFIAQVAVVGMSASLLADRAIRRVLPLASLLNMTLVFPDRAPSRFGVALRAGSLAKLRGAIQDGLPTDHQEAAELLVAMVTTLGRHERLTRGHSERVRAYADLIGEQLDLSPGDRSRLSWAALVHDIGKLAVPAEILSLPNRPTAEQWEILAQHPVAGGQMAEPLESWLGEWRLAASQHHERWDGQGYPLGLAGTAISVAGRIVAVADAFDVITSTRSYKAALSSDAAREEMVRCSGRQFDPVVVRALLEASLNRQPARVGFLGWLAGLGWVAGLSTASRAAGNWLLSTSTAAVVIVGAVAGTPLVVAPGDEDRPLALPFLTTTATPPSSAPATAEVPSSSTTTAIPTTDVPITDAPLAAPSSTLQGEPPSTTSESTMPSSVTTAPATAPPTTTTTTASPTTTSQPTTTTTSAPPTTTTTATTQPPPPVSWLLGSGGATTSQSTLPLAGSTASGALPNYDTDRDSDPGLLVQKGDGLGETDNSKVQLWTASVTNTRIQGTPELELWAATKDFDTDKTGRLDVGVYRCNPALNACILLSSGSVAFDQNAFGGNFGQVTVALDPIDHLFEGNKVLVVEIAPDEDSDDDLWFAYGTDTYPSSFAID